MYLVNILVVFTLSSLDIFEAQSVNPYYTIFQLPVPHAKQIHDMRSSRYIEPAKKGPDPSKRLLNIHRSLEEGVGR